MDFISRNGVTHIRCPYCLAGEDEDGSECEMCDGSGISPDCGCSKGFND